MAFPLRVELSAKLTEGLFRRGPRELAAADLTGACATAAPAATYFARVGKVGKTPLGFDWM